MRINHPSFPRAVTLLFTLAILSSTGELFSQTFAWAYGFGGTGSDFPATAEMDANNNIYLTGAFEDTVDFDPGENELLIVSPNHENAFITKTNPNGELVWAKAFISSSRCGGMSIIVGPDGFLYATGYFYGFTDFDPSDNEFLLGPSNVSSLYIVKLDLNGEFIWAKSVIDLGQDFQSTVRIDGNGDVIVVGGFRGTIDFDPGPGVEEMTSAGNTDAFLLKLDRNGNFVHARSFGGSEDDRARTLAFDPNGNVYIAGTYEGTADFDPGSSVLLLSSTEESLDGFIVKLSPDGSLLWVVSVGGDVYDDIYSLYTDHLSNVIAVGYFRNVGDFDGDSTTEYLLTSEGRYDVFICKLDQNGEFIWAKNIGSTGDDLGYVSIMDEDQNIYISGEFQDTVDFDDGDGVYNLIANGSSDVFVVKMDENGNFLWANSIGGTGRDGCFSILLDSSGYLIISGYLVDTVAFILENGETIYASSGADDIFLAKLIPEDIVMSTNEQPKTESNQIVVYPNPTSGMIDINFGTNHDIIDISVLDALGGEVDTYRYHETSEEEIEIMGAPGLYFLNIRTENSMLIKKVIKH